MEPMALSIRAANRSERSWFGATSISKPIGSYSTDNPFDILMAGRPAPLAGKVLRERNDGVCLSPATGKAIGGGTASRGQDEPCLLWRTPL
jgi:hypothetical protein